ncbi:hypothetical protein UFOVP997_38 [uncultured Caudovirales phage]|uniref:Uncharacterized protein n=1 Tax=uncultured Caudovirales phage TaxID=2100421 RepID=A0A6J5Q1R7_9CAUD|nr:hypothetical protein UFOVP486_33 [uncultured Caudovirales phage]CAB4170254.1 hypothetical protein UFOVP911_14 [uncultured Caudovirales phage]CAB4177372.1 hypothetical protein UFOVP997_38 [uncultured Caudovirales phage]CAB4182718.1 hypothetical protein UFOVP1088_18 [uncultured Caudovirales phage]CAB4186446.1 hypothetical protein UFOVP1149_45 [uncultured Caudovirales phage]
MLVLALFVLDDLFMWGLVGTALFSVGSTLLGQQQQKKAEDKQAKYQKEAVAAQTEANKLQQDAAAASNAAIEEQNVSRALAATMARKDTETAKIAETKKITRNATKINPNTGISEQEENNDMYGLGLRIPTK